MEIKDSVSRDKALCSFIRKMTDPTVDIEADHESLVDELEAIYLIGIEKGAHRHSYARLSHFLYDQDFENEAFDMCIENLTGLEAYVEERDNEDLTKAFRKLKDHIDLEFIHIGQLKRVQIPRDVMDNLTPKIQSMENNLKETNEKINEQTVQSVTILGIFAGVVFAFSGGFSVLTSTLSNIHVISGKETLFFFSSALGIGCILYDVVFALMLFIGRYCDKEPKNIMEFTKTLNASIFIMIFILMSIYCLCYNGDIRLIPCGTG